ncbi:hypothetical protein [Streptosporangium sp. 'caverna']|uniref:hypothetical protein n=1 Tax=Streptosporangium sp. 'caverna' TaxID=2202249 RepID=UPI000D7DBAFE|nr:hypothetical protein [Streptosporangium sp. 'caverna']AWS43592.1 hypothetical protein DKM19_21665 [Streptosporangium sp. 'caverna']
MRALAEPVHLVGHDWGAALVLRVVTGYDVPVLSWAADTVNGFHPRYAFHDLARLWQTPGAGEEWMDAMLAAPLAAPDGLAATLTSLRVPIEDARAMEAHFEYEMSRAILATYRSAMPNHRALWQAVDAVGRGRGVHLPDHIGRPGVPEHPDRGWPVAPGVEARLQDAQDAAADSGGALQAITAMA